MKNLDFKFTINSITNVFALKTADWRSGEIIFVKVDGDEYETVDVYEITDESSEISEHVIQHIFGNQVESFSHDELQKIVDDVNSVVELIQKLSI